MTTEGRPSIQQWLDQNRPNLPITRITLETTHPTRTGVDNCFICESPVSQIETPNERWGKKIVVVATVPGYRCTNVECNIETVDSDASVEFLDKVLTTFLDAKDYSVTKLLKASLKSGKWAQREIARQATH